MSDNLNLNLPTNWYYIRNGDSFAGRDRLEDKSLHPKKVFCPTDGSADLASNLRCIGCTACSYRVEFLQWGLEALANGRYKLKARGAPTGALNNHVYAFLVADSVKAEEWVITKRGHCGQYT
jgi:Peptidase inhibitor I66